MTSVPNTETHWPAGFRIRPSADLEPADAGSVDVEVADVVTGRRFPWSPEALAEYILATGDPGALGGDHEDWASALAASDERTRLLPDWRHWQYRGWHPSDQFYIASRRSNGGGDGDRDGDGDAGRDPAGEIEMKPLVDGPPPQEQRPSGRTVPLGDPAPPGAQEISRLLVKRRSGRAYVPKPVPLDSLSGLLWYGLADVRERRTRREGSNPASPVDGYGSAWDFYLCVYHVDGLEPGTYRYDLASHELTGVNPGDHREAMIDALQGMHSPATAAWTLGLVADFPRYQWRYPQEHGLRKLYLESGILGQELIVLGMSYGLSTLVTPAQKDRRYLDLHGLPAERFAPVYTLTMGLSRGAAGVWFNGRQPAPPAAGAP